ncbi:hypothetical protein L596_001021 [Steinernema carpocapsae]|uniref:Uncharacterized protein n=1 Tax=Steinernema carpocapsae TaxID=34508 RepID=A0A4U8UKJ7_STECR|nr:hypothetical protein L596_001021 [Steinernema carpocapsae]
MFEKYRKRNDADEIDSVSMWGRHVNLLRNVHKSIQAYDTHCMNSLSITAYVQEKCNVYGDIRKESGC